MTNGDSLRCLNSENVEHTCRFSRPAQVWVAVALAGTTIVVDLVALSDDVGCAMFVPSFYAEPNVLTREMDGIIMKTLSVHPIAVARLNVLKLKRFDRRGDGAARARFPIALWPI